MPGHWRHDLKYPGPFQWLGMLLGAILGVTVMVLLGLKNEVEQRMVVFLAIGIGFWTASKLRRK